MALVDLIDILKVLDKKSEELSSVFGETDFLNPLISDITETILDFYGIPQDRTIEEGNKGYCRDGWYDLLWGEFCKDKISKKKLIEILKKGE